MRWFPALRWLIEVETSFDEALDWTPDAFLDFEDAESARGPEVPTSWSTAF